MRKHNVDTDVRRLLGHWSWTSALSPWQGLPFLLGLWLTQCPTCYQKAWKGHLCPAGLIRFIISSTFIRIALLLFIKERTMTPIYTQLNMLAILREWLLAPFYKELVGLKHEQSCNFISFSVSSKRIKMKAINIKRHRGNSKQNSQGTQNPLII